MNKRPTPETDQECFVNEGDFVTGDFARNLERQLAEARDELRRIDNEVAFDAAWSEEKMLHEAVGIIIRQRDELLAALEESLALNINWADSTEPHNLEYFSEYRAVITQARTAIAAVKGGE